MKEVFGKYTEGMKLADLHMHTNVSLDSKGNGLEPEELVDLASVSGLDFVAITDHHSLVGAEKARDYAAKQEKPVEVVTGIEISTDKGHIVGLYMRDPIGEVKLEHAIYEIHRQGGLVIVPHPFLRTAGGKDRPLSLSEEALNSVILNDSRELYFDGFEVYSQGAQDVFYGKRGRGDDTNRLALKYYLLHKEKLGAAVSSSDSHRIAVGRARTAYHGNIGKAIEKSLTVALQLDIEEQEALFNEAQAIIGSSRGQETAFIRRLKAHFVDQRSRKDGSTV